MCRVLFVYINKIYILIYKYIYFVYIRTVSCAESENTSDTKFIVKFCVSKIKTHIRIFYIISRLIHMSCIKLFVLRTRSTHPLFRVLFTFHVSNYPLYAPLILSFTTHTFHVSNCPFYAPFVSCLIHVSCIKLSALRTTHTQFHPSTKQSKYHPGLFIVWHYFDIIHQQI